ncbi:uncharacterized protein LOC122067782 isoform X1 [Macadamia integrifolia]|uniref:uncharacterized protein LOC122067782 isoform X1 n=1 Tax=Macadamia integrifolia TaxID=60698 RepID=UPI001C50066B|nr:uncharacterized protein LOC122067782 isoform X1 [Macadamia integrifolia]
MGFAVANLDLILVPAGLLMMFTYHLYLIYQILKYPSTTVIGFENLNRIAWVEHMMQGGGNTSLALNVISINVWGVIYLAIITLTLTSLIGALLGNPSSFLSQDNVLILGDTSSTTVSLKYISILLSFILAFGSFVQSARYFVQADFYISTPIANMPVNQVQRSVIRANNFWHLGLRLLYFAMAFLFWSFGPIPMFVSIMIMVVLLFFLDSNSTPLHHYRPAAKHPEKKKVED